MDDGPLKLALIRQRYTPFGGAERFMTRALEALSQQGVDITLISRAWELDDTDGTQPAWQHLRCDPPYAKWLGRAARDRSFSVAARSLLSQHAFDLIQTHERIPGCDIYRAGDGVHAAWLAERDRNEGVWGHGTRKLSPFHRHQLAAEAALYEDPELRAVICNSQMVADEIVRYYALNPSKIHLIYNGVDTSDFHPQLASRYRLSGRASLGIDDKTPLLLFVGNGFARKGLPQLIKAFACMEQDALLAVVGADRQLGAMQKLARRLRVASRVFFLGPQPDVRPCYGMADALVLPSRYDPCPNAALEALASGLPLLTSRTCGAQEWIHSGQNGYIADALDIESIAERLDDLCLLALRPEARAAARAAVQSFTLEAMSARLLDLYQSLLNEG